jgi:hypothetical protein
MGANRLGGEEFRAVMEAMPNVMKVLASSMRVSIGELRALSIAGKITAAEMVKAWGNPEIAAQFKRFALNAQTISGAWTNVSNELRLLVGEFAKATGFTGGAIAMFNGLAGAVRVVAGYIDDLIAAFLIYVSVVGVRAVNALLTAIINQRLLTTAHAEALMMNVAHEKAIQASIVATIASNRVSISDATAKLAEADAIGAVSVAHYNATRAAEVDIVAAQASRAATISNLAAIGKEAAATNALIASKGAAVSNALRAEMAAIMERRAIAKIELAQIDASIAAHQVQAAANVAAEQRMTAAMAQRSAMHTRLIALEEAQVIAEKQLAASIAGLTAAQNLATAGTAGTIAKLRGMVGRMGIWGIILFGVYELADALGVIDMLFKRTEEKAAEASAKRANVSLQAMEKEIANLEKLYAAQVELEKSRTGIGGALKQAIVGATEIGSAALKKMLDEARKTAADTRAALIAAAQVGPTAFSPSKAWSEFHASDKEKQQAEVEKLHAMYLTEAIGAETAGWDARLKLANEYVAKYNDILAGKSKGGAGPNPIEQMRIDLATANDAEVSGRLSNVEKVQAAWDKYTEHRAVTEEMLRDKEAAMAQARIADWHKLRDQIASSLTSGIMQGFENGDSAAKVFEDMTKKMFKDMVLEPSIKAAVTAGVDWVRELIVSSTATERNTLALERNTAAQSTSSGSSTAGSAAGMSSTTVLGYVAAAYVVAKVYQGFFGHGGTNALGPATYEGSFSRGGNFQGGVRQGYKSESGAFTGGTQYTSSLTGMSPDQIKAINKTIVGLQSTFNNLGSAIGDLSIRTRQWSASFAGAADINAALANSMGQVLIPALEKFRLVGEDLAKTAERLTGVFTTTNTFIVALGVSPKEAFGSLGIASADARQALIDAAGGVDAFNQKAGSFIQKFLTDAQQLQPALDAVGRTFAELGISGVTTNAQFADLVAAELKLGHYDVVDRLLSVGDAFNAITGAAKATQDQLLGMLKISSFETLVSYQRARGRAGAAGSAETDIAKAISDATTTLPEEDAANQSAARKARKEQAYAYLMKFSGPEHGMILRGSVPPAFMSQPPLNLGAFNAMTESKASYRARIQAIYDSLPAFATGGDHMGGLRLVGENGPEIEATGPSRIYNASQTRAMMGGGAANDTVAEIRQFREEAKAHAIALNTATQKLAKIADRWDLQGLPPERIAG